MQINKLVVLFFNFLTCTYVIIIIYKFYITLSNVLRITVTLLYITKVSTKGSKINVKLDVCGYGN